MKVTILNLLHNWFFILIIFLCAGIAQASDQAGCLLGKVPELKQSGFSGPLLCNSKRVSFKLVGKIATIDQTYLIYDYKYSYKLKHVDVYHGGQRVIIFNDQEKYIGQYKLNTPPGFDLTITGTQVRVSVNDEQKGVIEFSNGIEKVVSIDGENEEFFK